MRLCWLVSLALETISGTNTINFINELGMQMDVILAMFWAVWRPCNLFLFQNLTAYFNRTNMKSLSWLQSYGALQRKVTSRVINLPLVDQHGAIGFFDGVE